MDCNAIVSITEVYGNKEITWLNKEHNVLNFVHFKFNFPHKLIEFCEIKDDSKLTQNLFRDWKYVGQKLVMAWSNYFYDFKF